MHQKALFCTWIPIGCMQTQGTGKLESVEVDDWTPQTLPTWRHSNWVGVWDPWPVIFKLNPFVWYKVLANLTCESTRQSMRLQAPGTTLSEPLCRYLWLQGALSPLRMPVQVHCQPRAFALLNS